MRGVITKTCSDLSNSVRNIWVCCICFLPIGSTGALAAEEINTKSLCKNGEKVYFSCQVNSKVVSLCGSSKIDQTTGYLQYRFGLPNKSPELSYPLTHTHPRRYFVNSLQTSAKTFSYEIGFRKDAYSYRVYVDTAALTASLGYGIFVKKDNEATKITRCTRNVEVSKEAFSSFYENNVIPKISPLD